MDLGSRIWLGNFRKEGKPGRLLGTKNWMQVHHNKEWRTIRITPRKWVTVLRKRNCVYYKGLNHCMD